MGISVGSVGGDTDYFACQKRNVQIGTGTGGAVLTDVFNLEPTECISLMSCDIFFHDLVDTTVLSAFSCQLYDGTNTFNLNGGMTIDMSAGGATPLVDYGTTQSTFTNTFSDVLPGIAQDPDFYYAPAGIGNGVVFKLANQTKFQLSYTEDTDTDVQADVRLFYQKLRGITSSITAV